ncbi:MAG: chromosomal replication initiator protein DnaA [Saprospiraceae bacterium]|nr:chromosomal replication initiator protein DnaA [Saprospiraceae bacterium]
MNSVEIHDCKLIWENCLKTIKQNVNQQSFKTWFEPIRPVKLQDAALTIQVPNKFFYEWLEEHYINLLKVTIRQELGEKGRLEYQILMNKSNDTKPTKIEGNSKSHESTNGLMDSKQIKNPFVIPGIRKIKVDSQLNSNYTFENFIEGECNRLARSAGKEIAAKPGLTAFNPLVIYGDSGLGKSHLVHSIGNETLKKFPTKNVLYISSEKFVTQIVQSIKNQSITDVTNFYETIDLLIVDDIQFLGNKKATQEVFFHIFNQLHQTGKQIIITSDKPPKDLEGIEERLISRFKWGLTADLTMPDINTRIAILEKKLEKENVKLDKHIMEYICYNISNNIRELEGVMVSIIAELSLNKKNIDLAIVKDIIKKFVRNTTKELTIDHILNMVSTHLNIPLDKIQGKSRKRNYVEARQLTMYLAKNLTGNSLKSIGQLFGGKDHSTVIYSCKSIVDMMHIDPVFKDTVETIEKNIKMSINS